MTTNKDFELSPSSYIEFEPVAPPAPVGAAMPTAAPVDDKIDADPLSINFGRDKESKPTAAERMLAGPTIDWLIAFPADARPKALCDRYPHVANRLASAWTDRAASVRSLEQLIGDARWGSAGFPAQVQNELQRVLASLG